jgi:hypothetical protein
VRYYWYIYIFHRNCPCFWGLPIFRSTQWGCSKLQLQVNDCHKGKRWWCYIFLFFLEQHFSPPHVLRVLRATLLKRCWFLTQTFLPSAPVPSIWFWPAWELRLHQVSREYTGQSQLGGFNGPLWLFGWWWFWTVLNCLELFRTCLYVFFVHPICAQCDDNPHWLVFSMGFETTNHYQSVVICLAKWDELSSWPASS